jgi:hypothetical protein
MKTFLPKVIQQVLSKKSDLTHVVFVLPNQRAGVYLREAVKEAINGTGFLPQIITFDNLAEQISNTPKVNPTVLLFDFYSIYLENTPPKEVDSFEVLSSWANIV